VVAIAILTVSSLPRFTVRGPLFPGCDKLAHFIEYLILGAALRYWSGDGRKRFLAGGIIFAVLDELHQAFIPGRQASFWDVVADVLGLVVGFVWSKHLVRKERYG
jgi:VanZ family protein